MTTLRLSISNNIRNKGNNTGNKKLATIILVTIIAILIPYIAVAQPSTNPQFTCAKDLAVIPFITVGAGARQSKQLDKTLDCEFSGLCTIENDTITRDELSMTKQLREEIADYYGDSLVPQPQVTELYLSMEKSPSDTPRDIVLRMGKTLNVSQAIVGIIWRYQDRNGGSWSAEQPASVAFSVYLVDITNQKLLWENSFDKTQEALSENLFNLSLLFSSGLKWVTAEEMAKYGMKQVLEDFPQALCK